MGEEQIPRAWIGEEILIHFVADPDGAVEFHMLVDVVPEGLVVERRTQHRSHILVPWHSIHYAQVYLGGNDLDSPTPDAG
jgi:hypothetical protein